MVWKRIDEKITIFESVKLGGDGFVLLVGLELMSRGGPAAMGGIICLGLGSFAALVTTVHILDRLWGRNQ